jgi:hypothetical protein
MIGTPNTCVTFFQGQDLRSQITVEAAAFKLRAFFKLQTYNTLGQYNVSIQWLVAQYCYYTVCLAINASLPSPSLQHYLISLGTSPVRVTIIPHTVVPLIFGPVFGLKT